MIEEMMSGNTSSFASELKRIQSTILRSQQSLTLSRTKKGARKEDERVIRKEKKGRWDVKNQTHSSPWLGNCPHCQRYDYTQYSLIFPDDDLVDVEEMEEEDDDTGGIEMYDVVRPLRISGKDYEIGFNLTCESVILAH